MGKSTLCRPQSRGAAPPLFAQSMSSTLHPMLNVAIRAARAAGAIINRAALDVEAVRISQKQGKVNHQYTPSTTVWFSSENGRTLRTPS